MGAGITHSVFFKLRHPKGSEAEKLFFDAARKLATLGGVKNFQCLKQLSSKNKFEYGISMEFDTQADYDSYNNHPNHLSFVKEYWLKDVVDFMEIDFESLI